jgi:hypothetical protein
VLVAVLGAGCTEDRPATTASPEGASPEAKPRCEARLGVAEGFMLVRTRDNHEARSIGVREEYRDTEGATLTYLLGIYGEVGEGLPFEGDVELSGGATAGLLGRDLTWVLRWEDEFPCEQIAVIGNGMTRQEFEELMTEAGVLGS